MKLKAYFVTSNHCGHCDIALDALTKVYGDTWKPIMELIETSHPLAKDNEIQSTPTLIVVNESDDNKVIANVGGSNNLNEEFWTKFFKKV
jgi:hypothetical protein